MGETTGISWCDHTFNPWIGCTKLTPACDHCYAKTLMDDRYHRVEWGPGKPRVRTSVENWKLPYRWERSAIKNGTKPRVFCASLADWADVEVPEEWVFGLSRVIWETPHLEWLMLSKRHSRLPGLAHQYFEGATNVRFGVTVEDDHHAKMRLPYLQKLKARGYPTFVSYEPALGRVDWAPWMDCIDWLIAGGESGGQARYPEPAWFRKARDICADTGTPFHFKQHGAVQPGRVLDGREHLEFPDAR